MEQFEKFMENILRSCINFLPNADMEDFLKYLNGNQFSICNMFITKLVYLINTVKKCLPGSIIVMNCSKNNLLIVII